MQTQAKKVASEKQMAFISKLVDERDGHVAAGHDTQLIEFVQTMILAADSPVSMQVASNTIDALLKIRIIPTPQTTEQSAPAVTIPLGTYTVVLNNDDNDYVTLRVSNASVVKDAQKVMVSYLCGSDNDMSYKGFGFIDADGVKVWNRFKSDSRIVTAANVLWALTQKANGIAGAHEEFLKHAEAYALASGKCARCNRTLTVPASLHRGLGPECANKEGL